MNNALHALPLYTPKVQEMLLQQSLATGIPMTYLSGAFLTCGENEALFQKAMRVHKYTSLDIRTCAKRLKAWSDAGEMTADAVLHLFPEAELYDSVRQQLMHALFDPE